MSRKMSLTAVILCGFILVTACNPRQTNPTPQTNIANPASVYCEQNGGILELRQDASGGVVGVCVFPDGSECDEWAYFRGECSPGGSTDPDPEPASDGSAIPPTHIPTPLPIDPAVFADWSTYTNADYGFSLRLPPGWVVDEANDDPLLGGHLINLHPQNYEPKVNIRLTFRLVSEQVLLWPTGVGAGEFVSLETLEIANQPAQRLLFVCPSGEINAIWYHQGEGEPNLRRGDLEFGIIFSFADVYCQEGYSLIGELQRQGETIIASLQTP